MFILIVYFVAQRTPIQGTKPNFTTVDMKQKSTPPSGEDFGLYVHKAEDGWKVKATNDQNKWTTFSITSFKYQSPPETGKQLWRTSVCTYKRLRNLCNVKTYSEPYCIRSVTFTNQNPWNGLHVAKILQSPVTSPIPRVLIGGRDPPLCFTCCKDSAISCMTFCAKSKSSTRFTK